MKSFNRQITAIEKRVRRKGYKNKAEDLAEIHTLYDRVFVRLLKVSEQGREKSHLYYLKFENRLNWLDVRVGGKAGSKLRFMVETASDGRYVVVKERAREAKLSDFETGGSFD